MRQITLHVLYSAPYTAAVKSRRLRCGWNVWSEVHTRFWRENQMQRCFEEQAVDGRIILERFERDTIGNNSFGLE